MLEYMVLLLSTVSRFEAIVSRPVPRGVSVTRSHA